MKNVIFLVLILALTGCKRQLVEMGWIRMEKENIFKIRGLNWRLTETKEDLTLYFEHGNFSPEINREDVKEDIEDAYERILKKIGVEDYDNHINVFFLNNKKSMRKVYGTYDSIKILDKEHIILMQYNEDYDEEYEAALAYIMLKNLWGETAEWMLFGYTNFLASKKEEENVVNVAELLKGNNISISEIIKNFEKTNPNISHPIIESFIRHLVEEYGNKLIKIIWLSSDILSIQKIQDLEVSWKKKVLQSSGENGPN